MAVEGFLVKFDVFNVPSKLVILILVYASAVHEYNPDPKGRYCLSSMGVYSFSGQMSHALKLFYVDNSDYFFSCKCVWVNRRR